MAYYGKLANILPVVKTNIKLFGIKTDDILGLTSIPIQVINVLYGSVFTLTSDTIIVGDTNPVGLVCEVIDRSVTPIVIATVLVYFNAVSVPTLPDNFSRLVQKIPKGVFESVTPFIPNNVTTPLLPVGTIGEIGNPQGWDFKARSQLLDDFYNKSYLPLYDELYSRILTSDLIYEFTSNNNFTSNVTTLNPLPDTFAFNSVYPNQLALLMASVLSVGLNQYDLSLFVSRYIYYRTGIPAIVLLDISINNYEYMRLSPESESNTESASWSVLAPEDFAVQQRTDAIVINEIQDIPDGFPNYGWSNYAPPIPPAPIPPTATYLKGSAYLAPEGYQPVLNNLRWYINSDNENLSNMQNELQALINNISRGDIGNKLFISNFDLLLTFRGYTYKFDPRFVNPPEILRAIRYTSDEDFPINIELYEIEGLTWQLTH